MKPFQYVWAVVGSLFLVQLFTESYLFDPQSIASFFGMSFNIVFIILAIFSLLPRIAITLVIKLIQKARNPTFEKEMEVSASRIFVSSFLPIVSYVIAIILGIIINLIYTIPSEKFGNLLLFSFCLVNIWSGNFEYHSLAPKSATDLCKSKFLNSPSGEKLYESRSTLKSHAFILLSLLPLVPFLIFLTAGSISLIYAEKLDLMTFTLVANLAIFFWIGEILLLVYAVGVFLSRPFAIHSEGLWISLPTFMRSTIYSKYFDLQVFISKNQMQSFVIDPNTAELTITLKDKTEIKYGISSDDLKAYQQNINVFNGTILPFKTRRQLKNE